MKFTVPAGDLAVALRGPYDRAKAHSIIPILKHIRFDANKTTLSLLGHELDASSEALIGAEVLQSGAVAIPAEQIVRLVSGLPKTAHISFEVHGKSVTVKSGRSQYKFQTESAEDMPPALAAENPWKSEISEADLDQLLVRPRAAVNPNDGRPVYTGVFLHENEGKICSVGTYGYVMQRFASSLAAKGFTPVIVPARAIDEIAKMGKGEVSISSRIISYSTGGTTYSSKLVDATFPEQYRRIIPEIDGPVISVDRQTLIECLQRLRAVARSGGSELADLTVENGELSVASVDGFEKIEVDAEAGTDKFVCCNIRQLLECAKALRGETAGLFIRTQSDAVRIVDPSEPSAIAVLMPCASKTLRAKQAA